MLKQEFDVNLGLLDLFEVLADLSYLGLVGDYDLPASSLLHRKPRRSRHQPDTRLTTAQRADNQAHARRRVRVEHALSGAKRLGSVTQACRNKAASFCDRTMALACGIWNSQDWFLADNWNPKQVPDATIDAVISTSPSGNRFPLIGANGGVAADVYRLRAWRKLNNIFSSSRLSSATTSARAVMPLR